MIVLVAVALACAFVTLDAEMEVGPIAACFCSVECSHSASETEAAAEIDDANRCVDRVSLTYDSSEMEANAGNCNYSSDNESARVLKLPCKTAGTTSSLTDINAAAAANMTGRYAGAGA